MTTERIILVLSIAFLCLSCNSSRTERPGEIEIVATNTTEDIAVENIEGAYFKLENNRFDFGKVDRDRYPDIPIEVLFSNIGKAPFVLLKADVSCGCVSVEFPKEPVLPGQTGKLTIHLDLRAQEGTFNKTIFIKSNAVNDVVLLRVTGNVEK